MAEKLGFMILAEEFKGVNTDKEGLADVYAEVSRLSATPSPENLYTLAELISFTATQVINQRLNWLDTIADVRRGAEGDKPEWDVPYTGIVVEIGAKGSTPQVSKIYNKKVVVPTFQISVRPKIDHQDFVQRPELILRSIEEAMVRMENALVKHMQDALLTTYTALSSPNYATGANVAATTFNAQLTAIQRFGQASVLGDIGMVNQLTELAGFNSRVADQLMIEANNNRFLGTYKGANVVELTNRYADEFSMAETNLVLRKDLLFVVPTGSPEQRPLKVFMGGAIRTANRTNFEDESYELIMRMDVGVAVIGNQLITAIYKDTNR